MRPLARRTRRSRTPERHGIASPRTAARSAIQRADPVLRLQRTIGNHAVQRMLQSTAPSAVHDVLGGPGKPLDRSAAAFMTQRFGHDFGHVRVHADAAAAASAHAIDALAYTSGHHIVFGAGQYAPHTPAGRTLLAHELTHVVQQGPPGMLRRQPAPTTKKEKEEDARLQALAESPSDAHAAWKRLSHTDRQSVIVRMTVRYGEDFAKSFLAFTKKPIPRVHEGSNVSYHTPDWFRAHGYQLRRTSQGADRNTMLEFWVHPSGREIARIVSTSKGAPKPPEPPAGDCRELLAVTLDILNGALAGEKSAQGHLEAEKERLEKMNKTTDAYCDQFDRYVSELESMTDRIKSEVADIETLRDQLIELKCTLPSDFDSKLEELKELQTWSEVNSSPPLLYGLACLKTPPPKDIP